MQNVLIIANARYSGGTSGGDRIYESFAQYWPCKIRIWSLRDIDYKPFALCYIHRIFVSCIMAVFEPNKYDAVYTASDFMPDSLAGVIFKLKGNRWIAGFFLQAFKENRIHYFTQKIIKKLINKYADMVIVTNETMYPLFPDKRKTWINGGVDGELTGINGRPKKYDAVFCGRIHPSKGIDEMLDIWIRVKQKRPDAKLAVIGDGDLGVEYIRSRLWRNCHDVDLFGHMGDDRYEIYKQSKCVIYPTPKKYDHFSMAPVEAMACGCRLICFDNPVNKSMAKRSGAYFATDADDFVTGILTSTPDCRKSRDWAMQFNYKDQSLRVYDEVRGII